MQRGSAPCWAGLRLDRPRVMAILNVTPDSFSDGGDHADPERAIAAGLRLSAEGADIVDIGGESVRPGALAIPPAVEQARVLPVVRALAAQGVLVSIDSRNADTMAAALDAGAAIVNDVSGLSHDPGARTLVAERACAVVLMHMRGDPTTMEGLARYDDVVLEVRRELATRVEEAEQAGIRRDRIVLDPGISFAKRWEQNITLLRGLPRLAELGLPLLIGVSRKLFVRGIAGTAPAERLAGSIAAGLFAVMRGAA
ncbi:MAG TPA: dihydropteroate synthase, partial [Acetobacteraceae bacterium]|nr:dihydropteroate synthase [Acetobacteraceae bacterium]